MACADRDQRGVAARARPRWTGPTGSPSTVRAGQAHLRHAGQAAVRGQAGDARAQRLERRQRQALAGRRERRRRHAQDGRRAAPARPGGRAPRRASARPTAARSRRSRCAATRPRATLNAMRGLSRSSQSLKVSQASLGLQRALRARPDRQPRRRQQILAHVPHQRRPATGPSAAARRRSRHRPGRMRRPPRRAWSAGWPARSARRAAPRRRGRRSRRRARTSPVVSELGRLRHHAGEVEPAVGRPDAVEAAEARRHAHRAAACRCRARCRTDPAPPPRPSPTRSRRARARARRD